MTEIDFSVDPVEWYTFDDKGEMIYHSESRLLATLYEDMGYHTRVWIDLSPKRGDYFAVSSHSTDFDLQQHAKLVRRLQMKGNKNVN